MVNFDTQYTNINYPNNNTSNKKAVLKNDDDAYYESIIKKFGDLEKFKEENGYNGSPDVKEVENSLYKRYMEDKCRRKNKISIWKNKTSIKVEILFFYKP
ncbi:aspartate racemase [Campylobacter jejuni]|nr:aspartate racemase [Campylobacter jejuni]EDO9989127.1 aspartate racemase [Campylobacter jejuni]EHD5856362.1 aspartate racemase [Campylobacter jejuni]